MFTTTFYSFKGGVGRTMALANIAAHLADSGEKVLVVDFDLEAPGLKSLYSSSSDSPGIIEFIQEYMRTQEVPDVRDFCYKADVQNSKGELWVMPASINTEAYAESLAKIDWQDLYRNRNGYLLIEDLKQQWESFLGVDYAFIDSRTGHTDVEGICTRQLPDALVTLFYPNSQNLVGIKEVSERLKKYLRNNENRSIRQLYVASNVPDLDDEHDVLRRMLNRFRASIDYERLDSTIHHYPSLLLLDDPIFVRSRPKTSLAREYRELSDGIRMLNAADEFGVKSVLLHELTDNFVPGRISRTRRAILDDIYRYHSENAELLHLLSIWKERRGETEESAQLLDRSIQLGLSAPDVLLRHAKSKAQAGDIETARNDVSRALTCDEISLNDLVGIVQLSQKHGLNVLSQIPHSSAVMSLDEFDFCHLIEELKFSSNSLRVALDAIEAYEKSSSNDSYWHVSFEKTLVQIGLGHFQDAMQCISATGRPGREDQESQLFNYAMAEWGLTGEIPEDLFRLVLDTSSEPGSQGANYNQCLAIASWACGDIDLANQYIESALSMLEDNYKSIFSCWSYLMRSGDDLRSEVLAVKELIEGRDITPMFMEKSDLFEVS